jgi:Glycosyl hydrolases family 38 N-terminal domain/Glycosyl hydrolases family 38 C-terminal domain
VTVSAAPTPGAASAARAGRVALPERDIEDGPREELRRGVGGVELALPGLVVRAGDLPLLRHRNGGLEQAVRVVVEAKPGLGPVRLALPGAEPASVGGHGRQRVLLYVPETREPRPVVLAVEVGGTRHELPFELRPQRRWEVYLCHHSHLDIGYTDRQDLVLAHHLRYLDSVLELAEHTDSWPEDARFRWNVEVTWPLEHWLAARPRPAREALLARAREGQVEICALPFSMHTEAYSIDELARGLRFADTLREEHGVPIVTAMQTDVPGAVAALPVLLADAGIRYLALAHNYAGRSVPHLHGGQRLGRPFWWQAPAGGRVLVWYTDSPHGVAYMEGNLVGLAESAELAEALLPEYLAALASRPYPYTPGHLWLGLPEGMEAMREPYPHDLLHLRVQSVIADNAPPGLGPAEVVRDWNARFAYPRLRLATNREFFERAEERFGPRLETHEGDWTDWWADGIGSGARALGFNRVAQGAVRSAQTLQALADALDEPEREWPAEADRAYASMALFDEHTWGAANPWQDGLERMASGGLQWRRKEAFAHDAYDRSTRLLEAGAERLARAVTRGGQADGLASVVVLNPSGFARTELVRAFVPFSRVPLGVQVAVEDVERGERQPHVAESQEHARFRPAGRFLSFVARDVPACGFRRYALVVAEAEESGAGDGDPFLLETKELRLGLDPAEGFVTSLVDLDAGSELVGEGAFGFNQYIYDRYASAARFNHLSSRIPAAASGRWLLGDRSTARYPVVAERSSNAVWEQVVVRLQAEGADWLESSYRLVRGLPRLEITNRLAKRPTDEKESVFFAFPLALAEPEVAYEITGGVAATGEPRVPGSASHMRAVRHWVALADDSAAVAWATLEAPLVQVGNLHLPYAPFPETVAPREVGPATVFSWAMNNVWDTNFPPAQGGETTFRYAVAPGPDGTPPRQLGLRTAASLAAPLAAVCTAARGAAAGSFCALDRDDVELVTIERSRRGHDLVLFLQSYAAEPVELGVAFPDLSVVRALAGTFLERELREAGDGDGARLRLPPYGFATLALDLRAAG